MINDLIKLANHLDKNGYKKEANYLDGIIESYANRLQRAERRSEINANAALCEQYEKTMKFFEEHIIPRVENNELQHGLWIEQEDLRYTPYETIPTLAYYGLDTPGITHDMHSDDDSPIHTEDAPTLRQIFSQLEYYTKEAGCNSLSTKLRNMWSVFSRVFKPSEFFEQPSETSSEGASEGEQELEEMREQERELEEMESPVEEMESPVNDLWSAATIHEPSIVRRGGW